MTKKPAIGQFCEGEGEAERIGRFVDDRVRAQVERAGQIRIQDTSMDGVWIQALELEPAAGTRLRVPPRSEHCRARFENVADQLTHLFDKYGIMNEDWLQVCFAGLSGCTLGTAGPRACAKEILERGKSVPNNRSASGRTTLKFRFM
jgi:hypothetical protein